MSFARRSVGCVKRTKGMPWCVARTLLGLAIVTALGGCGRDRGPERVVVFGTATHNGKPVPKGTIRFVPLQTSSVPVSGGLIADGVYKIDKDGGVPVGTHKIQIEAYRSIDSPNSNRAGATAQLQPSMMSLRQYIPEKYNFKTTLEVTVPPGSRQITKDFILTD
jgi:hypothetical protein